MAPASSDGPSAPSVSGGIRLLLTDAPSVSGKILSDFVRANGGASPDALRSALEETVVVTNAGRSDSKKLPHVASGTVSTVLSIAERPGHHDATCLAELARVLQPSGTLLLQEPVASRSAAAAELERLPPTARGSPLPSQAGLERALLLSGFASWQPAAPVAGAGLAAEFAGVTPAAIGSTQGPLLLPVALRAVKPAWQTGSSFSLKKKTPAAVGGVSPAPGGASPAGVSTGVPLPAAATWRVSIGDGDDDLVDEDTLLSADDLAPPAAPPPTPATAGCDSGKTARKACKNCTCGLAEMEAAAAGGDSSAKSKLTIDQINNPESACGSCGLGDAFRCAGCPYRGLPPFKMGEKISLDDSMLAADV
eukprot:TRINITY_DN16416_c0_g1_i2.p1 TRINITY_DN16416_c0_g1~~TRINITY_DN16416_c0_g1_i2.p1  ORF type:complete len:365 (-),score=16.98 TRINITY_DN16416_c0_g1_i2:3-1097(-)